MELSFNSPSPVTIAVGPQLRMKKSTAERRIRVGPRLRPTEWMEKVKAIEIEHPAAEFIKAAL
jgi:hypothetical protein